MIDLTPEQKRAYDRFIRARDTVKLVRTQKNAKLPYIPHREYIDSVHQINNLAPLFIPNLPWLEYLEASLAWWAIEPKFRNDERMRMSRGDYDGTDNWDEHEPKVRDMLTELKGK
jgi:hypothetical protein